MAKNFPHISDSQFPDLDTVNVYKYTNDLDYARFNSDQMRIRLCAVPWDLGEARVGQRTISGVGNVVYFDDSSTRNAFFDNLQDSECYTFYTKYRKFHSDDYIKVPIPITALADYNYVEITYFTEPTEGDPLEYENNKIDRWYYFIREFERDASNTTKCHILIDTWQTYIYAVEIPYMYLTRGHYPLAQIDADTYLQDPISNTEWLSGDDASFGEQNNAPHTSAIVHNDGTLYAVIATTTSYNASQGTMYDADSWNNPGAVATLVQNVPAPTLIVCLQSDLLTLLANLRDQAPQWLQGIQAVFLVSGDLIELTSTFTWYGVTCHTMTGSSQIMPLIDLDKSMFDYPAEYSDLAKLYTFPYASLDVYTERGDVVNVRIEDTAGSLSVHRKLNYVYPFIHLAAHIIGIGQNGYSSLTYNNDFLFRYGGRWYEFLQDWNIPCYAVTLDALTANEYETHWSREHNAYAAANTQANANATAATNQSNTNATASTDQTNTNATASTNQTNANASASTSYTNTSADADTMLANIDLTTDTNDAITANNVYTAESDNTWQITLNSLMQVGNTTYTNRTQRTTAASANAQAVVSAASSAVGGLAQGVLTGAVSGGVVGAAVGGVTGLVSGGISAASTLANTAITVEASEEQAEATNWLGSYQTSLTNTVSTARTDIQNNANETQNDYANELMEATTANSAATLVANAARTYSTEVANAGRTYDTEVANAARTYSTEVANAARTYNTEVANAQRDYDSAIDANVKQVLEAKLRAPYQFGNAADGDTAGTRPLASFCTVRTQSKGAIAQAGDIFLRYGYTCEKVINFDTFHVMPKFSFWQCSDLWLRSSFVPDAYMDQIRMLLFGGVTVWRDPADIGYVSIYDNK